VRRYRTEVVIPADRSIVLHLPQDLPEGRATIVVQVEDDSDGTDSLGLGEDELGDVLGLNRHDIEWWEEFEDEPAWGN
jgi:hypothetical protein